jgi:hypothetical protein
MALARRVDLLQRRVASGFEHIAVKRREDDPHPVLPLHAETHVRRADEEGSMTEMDRPPCPKAAHRRDPQIECVNVSQYNRSCAADQLPEPKTTKVVADFPVLGSAVIPLPNRHERRAKAVDEFLASIVPEGGQPRGLS